MSDQEQKTFEEGDEQPQTEEAISDLEPSEEDAQRLNEAYRSGEF